VDCQKAQDEWLAHANPLSAFLLENSTSSAGSVVPLSTFYSDLKIWADESGMIGNG